MRSLALALFVAVAPCSALAADTATPAADAKDAAPAADENKPAPFFDGLGHVDFKITTNSPTAQLYFSQGLLLAYGFNHAEAARSFREAVKLDPTCAMGWWGIALVLGPNINAPMEPTDNPEAWKALNKAHEFSHLASSKEQALIGALLKRYVAAAPQDRASLDVAYADAMREVARQYPDDVDVLTLAAEARMDTHPWDYYDRKTFEEHAWTPEIVNLLEMALKLNPDHPGANHFYIHAVEASKNPERALPCAERLGKLCPGQGHLVHMPSHIYIRTGQYHDGSAVNEKAIQADDAYVASCHAQGIYPLAYRTHNHHFLWTTATFEGRSAVALEAARHTAALVAKEMYHDPVAGGMMQHWSCIPLFGMVRFGWWKDILLEPEPSEDLVYPRAVRHFARGLAFERTGHPKEADAELAALREAAKDSTLKSLTILNLNTTEALVDIAERVLTGEIASSRGKHDEAVAALRDAVAKADGLTYDEPPDWFFPVRQNLGAALLAAKKPAEAEAVYREDLQLYPDNGWSLFGLEQALSAEGKKADAADVHKRFQKAWAAADIQLTSSRM
ncbi:MAG: hypothetical protein U0167_07280 [bacterium]